MSDRIDPSQYPAAYDFRELAPADFRDGIDGNPNPDFPGMDGALVDYPGHHDLIPDPAAQYPAIVTTTAPLKQEVRSRPFGVGALFSGRGLFAGYAFRETGGAVPAVIRFRDGLDGSGPIIYPVSIPANGSGAVTLNPHAAIRYSTGLYVEIVSGSVEGAVFTVRDYRD